MKGLSAVVTRPGEMELREFPIPEVGADGMLLRVEMTAICGSDRRLYGGTMSRAVYPIIPGHEVVGWVEALGEAAAEAYGVKPGDRVGIEPYIMCNNCSFCLKGYYQLCKTKRCYGINLGCAEAPHLWGAYGDYMYVAPNSKVHRIADDVPAESACLSSVIGNGIRWIRDKGEVHMGDSVVICGPGAQGLASVVAAKESGAYPIVVIGITSDAPRLELAKLFGATHVVDAEREDAAVAVRELTGGEGADVVVDCTGSVPSMQRVTELARTLGRIVFVGQPHGRPVPLMTEQLVYKELTIRGGVGQAGDVEDAVRIINSRRYPIERIITHTYPLTRAREALEFFMKPTPDCIRVALVP